MRIVSIRNKYTNRQLYFKWIDREINTTNSEILLEKPLKLSYNDIFYFTHEKVVYIERFNDGMIIETVKKIFILQGENYDRITKNEKIK